MIETNAETKSQAMEQNAQIIETNTEDMETQDFRNILN